MNPLFTTSPRKTLALPRRGPTVQQRRQAGDDEPIDLFIEGSCRGAEQAEAAVTTRSGTSADLPDPAKGRLHRPMGSKLRPHTKSVSVTTTLPCTSWTTPRGASPPSRAVWLSFQEVPMPSPTPSSTSRRVPRTSATSRRLRVRRAAQPVLSSAWGRDTVGHKSSWPG